VDPSSGESVTVGSHEDILEPVAVDVAGPRGAIPEKLAGEVPRPGPNRIREEPLRGAGIKIGLARFGGVGKVVVLGRRDEIPEAVPIDVAYPSEAMPVLVPRTFPDLGEEGGSGGSILGTQENLDLPGVLAGTGGEDGRIREAVGVDIAGGEDLFPQTVMGRSFGKGPGGLGREEAGKEEGADAGGRQDPPEKEGPGSMGRDLFFGGFSQSRTRLVRTDDSTF
jgi:hypothetical protein